MAPLVESALAGVGAALGFLALYATSQVLPMLPGDVKVMCPPLGAVAVLLFCLCASALAAALSALCALRSALCALRSALCAALRSGGVSPQLAQPPPSTLLCSPTERPHHRPKAPASSTYAVIVGHLVGGAVAVGVNQVLAKGDPMAPGVAVALAIFGMKLLNCVHPPAAACAAAAPCARKPRASLSLRAS